MSAIAATDPETLDHNLNTRPSPARRDPDPAPARGRWKAGADELPNATESLHPESWSFKRSLVRPRFVAAAVVVALSTALTLGGGMAAAATNLPLPIILLIAVGTVFGVLGAVYSTWPRQRVSPFPRVVAAAIAGLVTFLSASYVASFAFV